MERADLLGGVDDAFISPTDISAGVKFVIGGSLLVLLAGYLFLVRPPATAGSAP